MKPLCISCGALALAATVTACGARSPLDLLSAGSSAPDSSLGPGSPPIPDSGLSLANACIMKNGEACPAGKTCKQGSCSEGPVQPLWCTCPAAGSTPEPACQSSCGTPDAAPILCSTVCPAGVEQDVGTCGCLTRPPPASSCYIPGEGYCSADPEANIANDCSIATACPDSNAYAACSCDPNGALTCSGCSEAANGGCYIPNHGPCPVGAKCAAGFCKDGVTPVTCTCNPDRSILCSHACSTGGG
jgi:hypothetical protein